MNIRLVVNCTENISRPAWHGQHGTPGWMRFPVCRTIPRPDPLDPLRFWPVIAQFWPLYQAITEALKTGNVFIHCRAGAHRAGTVTSAFGMFCFGYTAAEAVRNVRLRRRVTQVDGDNMFLLRMLQAQLEDWKRTGSASAAPAAASAASSAASAAPAAAPAASSAASATPAAASAASSAASAAPAAAPAASSAASAAPAAASPVSSAVSVSSAESAAPAAASPASSAASVSSAASDTLPPAEGAADLVRFKRAFDLRLAFERSVNAAFE